jgi:uncharacterized protein YjbI with pentapeptide repeats
MYSGIYARADFTGAILNGSKVGGASFIGANFNDADMRCLDLEKADLSGAVANSKTIWPEYFDPINSGVIFID